MVLAPRPPTRVDAAAMPFEAPLRVLTERWADADPAERANAQLYLTELCDALELERPRPAGATYRFEYPVKVVTRDGAETTNFIDLYKQDHFVLEAKHEEVQARDDVLLRKAFGQARTYASYVPGNPPPYLLVVDVGRRALVWDRWSGDYGGFNAAKRIDLRTLADRGEDVALLRAIWSNPRERDPRRHAAAVTEEIASQLAELAASLEARGHSQEDVARFLMRCVFTMFAEDVGLLRNEPFRQLINQVAFSNPEEFAEAARDLWSAMDQGNRYGPLRLLRFNGHFFRDASSLPLTRHDLVILDQAARSDWRHVEPTIFGTLLTRALDPNERHRLGAEFTPRAFVERVVRPTIEEPIRERWTLVQAQMLQLGRTSKDRDAAVKLLRDFHEWLRTLKVLDPACGSGNFLYVALHAMKRVESEVFHALEELTGSRDFPFEEISPDQFYGIEIKPWAREIAELTLWIGYHQFWLEHHGGRTPPEPVLRDTGTLECKDAVLAWDGVPALDVNRARPDPTPRIRHSVTGKLVPDPAARLAYFAYSNPRPAAWPHADFIVGNPPYMGLWRQREELGDGYVDALRSVYSDVPDTADYVVYWWYRAAKSVADGKTLRAGLITTKTLAQAQNRSVIEEAERQGARVIWAVADHPWLDGSDSADVRVAMTVIANSTAQATLLDVDSDGNVISEISVPRLNADLSSHADIGSASQRPLLANAGVASPGFKLHGAGFILDAAEAQHLLSADARNRDCVRLYRNGRDIAQRSRGVFVIDFGIMTEREAKRYPLLYDIVRTRVKPERDANNDRSTREKWWRFGRNREEFRPALAGLDRFIATPETARYRYFRFLGATIAPDNTLVCIASDQPFHLGVLSSEIHVRWALEAGGRLGVGNDPRYNKTLCFDSFPFPEARPVLRGEISEAAEELDRLRTAAIDRADALTLTKIYGVLAKLRASAPLSEAERIIHDTAACGVLLDLHSRLDALVAEAYGWPWPIPADDVVRRLVQLHDERLADEARGEVQWLRLTYQRTQLTVPAQRVAERFSVAPIAHPNRVAVRTPWPATAVEQIAALKASVSVAGGTSEDAAKRFKGAKRELVERHLDTLAILGEVHRFPDGRYAVPHVATALTAGR